MGRGIVDADADLALTPENREVTGSTPVGATGPSSGFCWRRASHSAWLEATTALPSRNPNETKRLDRMSPATARQASGPVWAGC